MQDYDKQRQIMVDSQIKARGISDEWVIKAMSKVKRELFIPPNMRQFAYQDRPVPIGEGQTISQPFIVAYMVEALGLKGGEKVLEIGAGSGYAAAIMAEIASEVYAIERIKELAQFAKNNLQNAGYKNVHIRHSDGTLGWEEKAPFDAILVSAGAPAIPENLKQQLAIGAHLIAPVGASFYGQDLIKITRTDKDRFKQEKLTKVSFVPLIGAQGWQDS